MLRCGTITRRGGRRVGGDPFRTPNSVFQIASQANENLVQSAEFGFRLQKETRDGPGHATGKESAEHGA